MHVYGVFNFMQKRPRPTKYQDVLGRLRNMIDQGGCVPGMRLPPQTELFRRFGASDSTVVRALNELVREGLIVRRRGSGTFVADQQQPPLIAGRHLRLGVLWYQSVVPKFFNESSFLAQLTRGALHAWPTNKGTLVIRQAEPGPTNSPDQFYSRSFDGSFSKALPVP